MNVAEFIEYLKQFPQDAQVYVGLVEYDYVTQSDRVRHEPLDADGHGINFVDRGYEKIVFLGQDS